MKESLAALEPLYGQFSVHTLCDALEVSRGTFYNHILRNKRNNTWYAKRRAKIEEKVREIYEENHQIFGADKICAILIQRGERVSKRFVTSIMQDTGLVSMSPAAKKDHNRLTGSIPKKNILNQNFTAERPNQIWVSDITCYRLKGKHYYIAVILDLFSRKVIAYRISTVASTKLIAAAFRQAYAQRPQNTVCLPVLPATSAHLSCGAVLLPHRSSP